MCRETGSSRVVSRAFKQHYEDHYRRDERQWRMLGARDKAHHVISFCQEIPHDRILEIGCGDGAVLAEFSAAEFGRELYGLEISESARNLTAGRNLRRLVECRVYDGAQVPYPDNAFDLAVLTHVVEHLEHPRQLIHEAARVARHVFIEVPLEDTTRMPQDFVRNSTGHINVYSPKTIRRLVQTCDLRVLRQAILLPSKSVHTHLDGSRGALKYWVKRLALAASPQRAACRFVYHGALLCDRDR